MPDEGRNVWGDDVETRVRIPPARAASSSTSATLASSSPHLACASAWADGRGLSGQRGFDPRLVHVADCFTDSSGSPHLGYPSLGRPGYPGVSARARVHSLIRSSTSDHATRGSPPLGYRDFHACPQDTPSGTHSSARHAVLAAHRRTTRQTGGEWRVRGEQRS